MKSNLDHVTSLVIVAGLSGAGKTTALRALDDLGYSIIENLPVPLFKEFLDFSARNSQKYARTALLLEIESKKGLAAFLKSLTTYGSDRNKIQLVFLDCQTRNIVKRYSETRRPHPGFRPQKDRSLEEAINRERERFLSFREIADYRIDTTDMTVHDLKRQIREFVDSISLSSSKLIRVNFISFGFKYGIPPDCDLVVDVRFLANPYFVEELREKTGLDTEVSNYVLKTEAAHSFINKYSELLNFLLPNYIHEGKAYLNIGIGCTGGKHRSVALAEKLSEKILPGDYLLSVKHRDLDKSSI